MSDRESGRRPLGESGGWSAADHRIEPGALLVASPLLTDPNFTRKVIYVLDHRDTGTTGVVLGAASDVPVDTVLPGWGGLAAEPAVLFVGGPVETNAALCLSRALVGVEPPGWRSVGGPVGLTDLDVEPLALAPGISALRIFAGYAGWGASQLAAEISAGAWLVLPGLPDDVFAAPDRDLWRTVLHRQGGRLAMVATYPSDPTLN